MTREELAHQLDTAAKNATPIAQLSLTTQFDVDEAYTIQAASLQHRYDRGEKLVGLKMGFTSEAKMKQMGVHDMIWGRLTDAMLIAANGTTNMSRYIHPRAEPEVCFLIGDAIDRELSIDELKANVQGVAAAIEIIDSRYENFKFSLEDVIADNCSSTGLVIGEWNSADQPLDNLGMTLTVDGNPVQTGNSQAILGDPWKALQAATRLAAQYNQPIASGSFIMAGAATPAVFLEAGQRVEVEVERLGRVGFRTL